MPHSQKSSIHTTTKHLCTHHCAVNTSSQQGKACHAQQIQSRLSRASMQHLCTHHCAQGTRSQQGSVCPTQQMHSILSVGPAHNTTHKTADHSRAWLVLPNRYTADSKRGQHTAYSSLCVSAYSSLSLSLHISYSQASTYSTESPLHSACHLSGPSLTLTGLLFSISHCRLAD